jgi:hypothetical protein
LPKHVALLPIITTYLKVTTVDNYFSLYNKVITTQFKASRGVW